MLKKYAEKRNFDVTAEPDPFEPAVSAGSLRYVIQKHAARRLHYDLRLEWDGALKSWAVPKGFSFDPAVKHMAVMVEDHPLSYASFEGTIPKGEYGGGEVIVWDEGVYSPDDKNVFSWDNRDEAERRMREDLKKGKLSITLLGKKLRGSFTLIKTKKDNDWLLIKHKDAFSTADAEPFDERSILSGRTVEDVKEGRSGQTMFDRVASLPGAKLDAMPTLLTPMLLTETDKAFTNEEWAFELKLDGIRLLAYVREGKVHLTSRNGRDVTRKFPKLLTELATLPNCILDGEVVVFNAEGKADFQGLLERFQVEKERDIKQVDAQIKTDFCVFDIIYLKEWDLRKCVFSDRRSVLEELAPRSPSVRVLDLFPTDGELLFEHASALGFEGIVAKKLKSTYLDGRRTKEWLKLKNSSTEEFLIAGFTEGQGMRGATFGSFILASRNEAGKLEFCGTVGGGFSDKQLAEYRSLLDPLVIKKSPFPTKIDLVGEKPTWVEPKLWVEVKYGARTRENRLRFPIFQRMRPDLTLLDAEPEVLESMVKTKDVVASVLEQLATGKDEMQLDVGGTEVRLTSLSRILWPAHAGSAAVTKRDLIAYYMKMSKHLLYHLRDRPISFVRLPAGLGGERFFQKHWEKGRPEYVEIVPIHSSSNDRTTDYVLINNLPTLAWMGQMSALEIHPWYSRVVPDAGAEGAGTDSGSSEETLDASALSYPDFMVVDLDPNILAGHETDTHEPELNRRGWEMVVEVARGVEEMLKSIGLRGYPKTSGKAGLHIYVPLKRVFDYEAVKSLCETMGRHLEKQMPDKITMEWSVKKRPEKVFFDHNQNVRGKTLSGPFTVRAVAGAPVSMPLIWDQVSKIYPSDFTLHNVPDYMAAHKDPWAVILQDRQELPL